MAVRRGIEKEQSPFQAAQGQQKLAKGKKGNSERPNPKIGFAKDDESQETNPESNSGKDLWIATLLWRRVMFDINVVDHTGITGRLGRQQQAHEASPPLRPQEHHTGVHASPEHCMHSTASCRLNDLTNEFLCKNPRLVVVSRLFGTWHCSVCVV